MKQQPRVIRKQVKIKDVVANRRLTRVALALYSEEGRMVTTMWKKEKAFVFMGTNFAEWGSI